MFKNLKMRLIDVFKDISGKGLIKEADVQKTLRAIRIALIEADVSLAAIKPFLERVHTKALEKKMIQSLRPDQVLIKVVNDELAAFLTAPEGHTLNLKTPSPLCILMCGLQGSGKTTTAAKLAYYLTHKHQKKVLLASGDIYRPAAQEQLATLAQKNHLACLPPDNEAHKSALNIAKKALLQTKAEAFDVLIMDTAGRLQIDAPLMAELTDLKAYLKPQEILFVGDALMGQEALPVAKAFHEQLGLTGSVLSRADGDAKGGAALSIGFITQKPLKFLGVGEDIKALEVFDPQRMASRILDMGDIVSLVEEVESNLDQAEIKKAAERMQKGVFTLSDMEKQLAQMGKLGSFEKILGLLPGMGNLMNQMPQMNDQEAQKSLKEKLAIIRSMTPHERRYPKILGASRKRRVAQGSGTDVPSVNRLLKEFDQMGKMMKRMGKMNKRGLLSALNPQKMLHK